MVYMELDLRIPDVFLNLYILILKMASILVNIDHGKNIISNLIGSQLC